MVLIGGCTFCHGAIRVFVVLKNAHVFFWWGDDSLLEPGHLWRSHRILSQCQKQVFRRFGVNASFPGEPIGLVGFLSKEPILFNLWHMNPPSPPHKGTNQLKLVSELQPFGPRGVSNMVEVRLQPLGWRLYYGLQNIRISMQQRSLRRDGCFMIPIEFCTKAPEIAVQLCCWWA